MQTQKTEVDFVIIFFDLDGPILDVSERYFRLHRHIVGQFDGNVTDKTLYWHLKRDRRLLPELLGRTGGHISEEAYRAQWSDMIESPEYLHYDTVIPGAREQLERLQQCHTLVLVTLRRRPDHLETQLKGLHLRPFFAAVLSANSSVTDGLETKQSLIRKSGFFSEDALVVGDTEIDIRAGKALGLKTVAVLSGIRSHERLAEEHPDCIVEDINSLPQLVRDI